MDRFFSFFGKLALVLLVFGVLITGGYYLGTGKLPFPTNPPPAAVTTIAPQPSPLVMITTTIPPVTTPPGATISAQQVVVAALSGTSFNGFTMSVPTSWAVTKDENPGISQKITISIGTYAINIYRAATGGGQCLYPGDPPSEMSSPFGPFVTLHDGSGNEYRRATASGSTSGFTVCQKSGTTFGLPTMYGHVTYTAPASPDPAVLLEMDAIFASFLKS